MLSPDPQTSDLAFAWQTHWTSFVAVVVQVAVLAWYLSSARRLVALGRHWSLLRTASFVVGLLVTAYAVEGGIAYYQQRNFTTHVVQLLLLIDVAPPLLAMGAPLSLALQSSPRRVSAALFAALHSRTARALSNPLVALVLSMGTMYVYFLTPLYRFSEEHPVFLAYVHLQFFLAGCALWWLVVGRDALARRLGVGMRFVLVLVQAPCDAALGLVIAMATKAFYPGRQHTCRHPDRGQRPVGTGRGTDRGRASAHVRRVGPRRRTQGHRIGPPAGRGPGRRANGYRLWRARFRT